MREAVEPLQLRADALDSVRREHAPERRTLAGHTHDVPSEATVPVLEEFLLSQSERGVDAASGRPRRLTPGLPIVYPEEHFAPDRPLSVDRWDDHGAVDGFARGERSGTRASGTSSTKTSPDITSRPTPTSRRSRRSGWANRIVTQTPWEPGASARSALSARQQRSPTPSTTPPAAAHARCRSHSTSFSDRQPVRSSRPLYSTSVGSGRRGPAVRRRGDRCRRQHPARPHADGERRGRRAGLMIYRSRARAGTAAASSTHEAHRPTRARPRTG
jgi:hypothetical protein